MKIRELIRHLLEVENIDAQAMAINVHDPRDETQEDVGREITSVADIDGDSVALYFIGDKPKPPSDED